MEMPKLDYELHPTPGMPLAARKNELNSARFVAVRNLAYLIYKKPDGTPLMTYHETLDNRESVKSTILQHEMNCTYQGQPLVVNDGTPLNAPPTQAAQPETQQVPMSNGNGVPNGVPVPMAQPQYAVPQPASPAQMAAVPMQGQPQQSFAPPNQMAPQTPPQQQPSEAAPAGRKRRNAGAAVAPPPPSAQPVSYGTPANQPPAPPGYGQQPPQQAPQAAPQAQAQTWQPPAPPSNFSPPPMAPPGAPGFTPPPAPGLPQPQAPMTAPSFSPPPAAPSQASPVDLTPVLQRLDSIGQGVQVASKNGDEALKAVATLTAQIQALQTTNLQILTALHHMYLTHPQLSPATQGQANDLASFQAFLSRYIPQSPR